MSDTDTEFDAELHDHISLLTQRYIRQGMKRRMPLAGPPDANSAT